MDYSKMEAHEAEERSSLVVDRCYGQFLRHTSLQECVQNFDVFAYNGGYYMVTGMCRNSNQSCIDMAYYDSTQSRFVKMGSTQSLGNGHSDSIEVVIYNGNAYLFYVLGNFGEAHTIYCRQLIISGSTWSLASTEYTISPFASYNSVSLYHCMITSSTNYVCIVCSYGTSKNSDTERYHIYNKADVLSYLLSNISCTQLSLNAYRRATGMFTGTDSIGFDVSKSDTVIQSIELDEVSGSTSQVTVFANIDNRSTRMDHQVSRARLNLYTANSDSAKTAQNMKNIHCYYSCVDSLNDLNSGNSSISMNCSSDLEERFELEGIKKLSGLSAIGIPNGWYISVNSSLYKNVLYTSTTIGWNCIIYKLNSETIHNWPETTSNLDLFIEEEYSIEE